MIEKTDLIETVRYAFTITIKPNHYRFNLEQQYDLTSDILIKDLSNMGICKVTLVAESTSNLNLHYHGTISFTICKNICSRIKFSVRKKFIDSFRSSKLFGFVTILEITDEPGWINYINKQFQEFTDLSGRRPILKDDFNYFNPTDYAKYGTEW